MPMMDTGHLMVQVLAGMVLFWCGYILRALIMYNYRSLYERALIQVDRLYEENQALGDCLRSSELQLRGLVSCLSIEKLEKLQEKTR